MNRGVPRVGCAAGEAVRVTCGTAGACGRALLGGDVCCEAAPPLCSSINTRASKSIPLDDLPLLHSQFDIALPQPLVAVSQSRCE